MLMAKSN